MRSTSVINLSGGMCCKTRHSQCKRTILRFPGAHNGMLFRRVCFFAEFSFDASYVEHIAAISQLAPPIYAGRCNPTFSLNGPDVRMWLWGRAYIYSQVIFDGNRSPRTEEHPQVAAEQVRSRGFSLGRGSSCVPNPLADDKKGCGPWGRGRTFVTD